MFLLEEKPPGFLAIGFRIRNDFELVQLSVEQLVLPGAQCYSDLERS